MASNTPDQRSDEKVADFPRPENENDHVMGTQQQRDQIWRNLARVAELHKSLAKILLIW